MKIKYLFLGCFSIGFFVVQFCQAQSYSSVKNIDTKVDSVLKLMTLTEKVGQMNQYNGFWNITGPVPKNGNAKLKYDHLKMGLVGAVLNVKGVENVIYFH